MKPKQYFNNFIHLEVWAKLYNVIIPLFILYLFFFSIWDHLVMDTVY